MRGNSQILNIFLAIVLLLFLNSCKDKTTNPPDDNNNKPPGYQEDIEWPSLADSPWPKGNHDPQNTNRSKLSGPISGVVVDSIEAYNLQADIVVGSDSTLYFITAFLAKLTAVDFNGNVKWERTIAVESVTSPLIDKNNNIYAAGGKELFAFTSKGDTLWKFICDGQYITSIDLNIDKEGNLYVLDKSKTLYSISPNGTLNWKLTDNRIPPYAIHSPAISPDGKTIYVQGEEVSLFAIDILSGNIKWTFGNKILYSGPVVDSEGNIFIIPGDRPLVDEDSYSLFSLSSDGNVNWEYKLYENDLGLFGLPTIDKMGNLYLGSDSLCSISYNGKLNWKEFNDNGAIKTTIISDKENQIYFGTLGNNISSYTTEGIHRWSINIPPKPVRTPIIYSDNKIFLPTFRADNIFKIN